MQQLSRCQHSEQAHRGKGGRDRDSTVKHDRTLPRIRRQYLSHQSRARRGPATDSEGQRGDASAFERWSERCCTYHVSLHGWSQCEIMCDVWCVMCDVWCVSMRLLYRAFVMCVRVMCVYTATVPGLPWVSMRLHVCLCGYCTGPSMMRWTEVVL